MLLKSNVKKSVWFLIVQNIFIFFFMLEVLVIFETVRLNDFIFNVLTPH